MTIVLIAFIALWIVSDLIMDWIEHRKEINEKAKFQYVRRKRPAPRKRAIAQ